MPCDASGRAATREPLWFRFFPVTRNPCKSSLTVRCTQRMDGKVADNWIFVELEAAAAEYGDIPEPARPILTLDYSSDAVETRS